MADTVNVKPTPIQRNRLDAAIDLLNMHASRVALHADEIETIFAKYYSLVCFLESKPTRELQDLLTPDFLNKVGRLKEKF